MIVNERPPNFERILAAFPDADKPGVIFAYGTGIYNPTGGVIPPALLAHEGVHQTRQLGIKIGLAGGFSNIDAWWDKYITDPEFRYNEELLAHVAEFKAQLHGLDRNYRAKLLQATALRLVAPLYRYNGKSVSQALRDIRQELQRK